MVHYITKRLLYFIPTLIAISLLAFIISVKAPGDPVERMISVAAGDGISTQSTNEKAQVNYWKKKLGLDLPLFYFSVQPLSEPPVISSFEDEREMESIRRLSFHNGNAQATLSFHFYRIAFIDFISQRVSDSMLMKMNFDLNGLKFAATETEANQRIESLRLFMQLNNFNRELLPALWILQKKLVSFSASATGWKSYIPVITFHPQNQYHRWIFGDGNWITGEGSIYSKGIIRGDFGISYQTRQPVSEVIGEKIGWSLFFSVLSVFLAYLVSIPVGVWAGAKKDSAFDRRSSLLLFILYSMPSFWVATLLLMTFANPDVLHVFPASGIKPVTGYPEQSNLFQKFTLSLPYIILPLICYTYSSFAFLSRTIRVAVIESMQEDYIRTAMAKGLSYQSVVFRHAFRNSLLPLITVFANVFPVAIGGSVILETIFTIPGMGYETVQSIQNQNYPMIVAIFTITGFLTMLGYLVSDILYAFADPRITFTNKR